MATDVMIQANGLTKRFGAVRALDKVNFEVKRGEVVGFLGPNGAGKSTTMRILTCFISPSNGSAKVNSHDVFDDPLEVRRSIGYLPQRAPLYTDMTVWEYLKFAAEIRGLDESTFKKRLKKVVEVCGLAQSLGKDISTLSHGYRQRVGLGQALIHDPPILILDEPTSDLDPNEKAEVLRYIKEIGKDRTILLSTHNLAEVEEACARAIIVSKGRVVADGPLDQIRGTTGRVRYVVTIDEQHAEAGNKPPKAAQAQEALERLSGIKSVRSCPRTRALTNSSSPARKTPICVRRSSGSWWPRAGPCSSSGATRRASTSCFATSRVATRSWIAVQAGMQPTTKTTKTKRTQAPRSRRKTKTKTKRTMTTKVTTEMLKKRTRSPRERAEP